jgi:IS5 family transposase
MDKQMTLSALTDALAGARTHKREFLEKMERILPLQAWEEAIEPFYYQGTRGNKPYPLQRMLRIYMLSNLYNLSDAMTVDEIYDSRAFADFCGIDSPNQVPDGDTLGRFRNMLTANDLTKQMFAETVDLLKSRGLLLKKGTIVDSTIIESPTSTKNADKKRDPDAHQTKKGNEWHFGFKGHIGVDKDSGIVHTVEVTAANVSDVSVTPKLLHGEEEEAYGDGGYTGAEKREDAVVKNKAGKKIKYKIARRPSSYKKAKPRSAGQIKRREREKSSVRSKVEHVFGVVKNQLGYRKTRYKGLKKQEAKLNMMFALANMILANRPSIANTPRQQSA